MTATNEQVDVPTLIKALESHYTNNDGSPCEGLNELLATPAFEEAYNVASKTANGNAVSARTAALYSMAMVREKAAAVDVHVLNPRDTEIRGKGRDRTVVSDEDGNPIYGVSVVHASGVPRFMRNVPDDVAATLVAGQAAQIKGDVTITKDLLKGTESQRISSGAELVPGGHTNPFPRLGLDYHVGAKARENRWGPWGIDGRTNTIRGTFHAKFATDKPVYATLNLDGCAYINESFNEVVAFFNTDDGFKGVVSLPQVWINDNFGIPAGTDRDGYGDQLREKAIFVHITSGSLMRRLSPNKFGGQDVLAQEIADLEAQGLMTKPKGNSTRKYLTIPSDVAKQQMAEGDYPHVEIGDQKVYSIEKNGEWVDVYTLPEETSLTIECVQQERPKKDGGTWIKNEGGFAIPIGDVTGRSMNASQYDESDPLYRALMAFDMTSEADEEAPEPKATYNLSYGA